MRRLISIQFRVYIFTLFFSLTSAQTQSENKHPHLKLLDAIAEEILKGIPENQRRPTLLIAGTMEYVHNNSVHKIDSEHREYAFNIPLVLNKLHAASLDDKIQKPHLSCGPRAYAMQSILTKFNIYSRLVQVYSDEYDIPEPHRLLEVFNPENSNWETWDPDYGVVYIDKSTGQPTDIMSLVFGNKDTVIPIGVIGRGWQKTKTERLKNNYFEAVMFEEPSRLENATIIINTKLFDMTKIYSTGITFTQWARQHYKFPRIIELGSRTQPQVTNMKATPN